MTSYGFYTTQGILRKSEGSHRPSPDIIPLVDKYRNWLSFIIGVTEDSTHYYLASLFEYAKEPFGRFSRGVLVVDVESFDDMERNYLTAVKDLFQSDVADFSMESRLGEEASQSIPKSVQRKILKTLESLIGGFLRHPVYGITDIRFTEETMELLSDVSYPSIIHRWLFVTGIKLALTMDPSVIRKYELAIAQNAPIVYPLINYSKSAPSTLGGFWLVLSSEGDTYE